MRVRYLGILSAIVLITSVLAPHSLHAQDNNGLTEEEIAAIERVLSIPEIQETYQSYEIHEIEYDRIGLSFDSVDSSYLAQIETTYDTRGYTLRNENDATGIYAISLNYSDVRSNTVVDETSDNPTIATAPFQTTKYTMVGEIIVLDQEVYVAVAYTDATEDVAPLEDGWLMIGSIEAIPEAYSPLNIDQFLETSTNAFFEERDVLFEYVSSLEIEQSQTNTGEGIEMVERITISIEDENFEPYFRAVYGGAFYANSTWAALMGEPGMHGHITINADFTEQGDLFFFQLLITIGNQDLDASTLFPGSFEEGTTVTWSISSNNQQYYTNINGDFDPVVAPE